MRPVDRLNQGVWKKIPCEAKIIDITKGTWGVNYGGLYSGDHEIILEITKPRIYAGKVIRLGVQHLKELEVDGRLLAKGTRVGFNADEVLLKENGEIMPPVFSMWVFDVKVLPP